MGRLKKTDSLAIMLLAIIVTVSFIVKLMMPSLGDVLCYKKFCYTLATTGRLGIWKMGPDGVMQWRPDLPIAIYLLYLLASATGKFLPCYRILLSLGYSLLAIPTFLLAKTVYQRNILAITSAIAIVFNEYVGRLVLYGNLKAGLGHFFSVFAIFFLYKLSTNGQRRCGVAFIIFSILTLFTHTLATVLLAIIAFTYIVIRRIRNRATKLERKLVVGFVVALAVIIGTMMLLGPLGIHKRVNFDLWLFRYGEANRLFDAVSVTDLRAKIKIDWLAFVFMAFTIFFPLLALQKDKTLEGSHRDFTIALVIVSLFLFALGFMMGRAELGHRFLQVTFIPFSLLLPYAVGKNSFFYFPVAYHFARTILT